MADPPLGFHSLTEEVDVALDVEGDLPGWLSGTLIRNGPGAFELGDAAVDHWFDGLAMLTAFTFGDGVHYRNRFLRTDAYEAAQSGAFEVGFATGGSSLLGRLRQLLFGEPYDNTNVVAKRVGDSYVALTETPRWTRFDPDTLETLGDVQYDGPDPAGQLSCAHLRRDPRTGRLVNVETEFGRTSRYHVHEVLAPDERSHLASIPVEEPAYMHSFALTEQYVVLTEFPFVVDPMRFLLPGNQGPFVEQFAWKPEQGTRFVVIDRNSGGVVAEPRTDAFFGFHHVNAYQEGEELVVDLETVPSVDAIESLYLDALRAGELDALAGRLERFRVDLGTDDPAIERRELYDGGTALPTVPHERWTRPYRYAYDQGADRPVTEWPTRLVKVDVETGEATTFTDGGSFLGEPIFVPAPEGDAEDDGVVLSVALDREAGRSALVVLDGASMTEVTRTPLPHAVPFDFHGRFFPELTAGT